MYVSNYFSSHGVNVTANSPISCSEASFFDSRPGDVMTCLIWSVVFVVCSWNMLKLHLIICHTEFPKSHPKLVHYNFNYLCIIACARASDMIWFGINLLQMGCHGDSRRYTRTKIGKRLLYTKEETNHTTILQHRIHKIENKHTKQEN
jgi:hypothetical protein